MLHIYLWQHLTNCSQLLTSTLKQAWPMELSLVNKVTLGADESTSMSDTSELSIFINYVNPITSTLCDRLLCLVPLGSSKSASALHEVIVKVFSDRNLNIKNIFFNAFDGTNTISGSLQRYMRFESSFSKYINCRSHRFALVFVRLTRKYELSGELDSLLLQLWKKFKFSMTNKSVLEEIQQVQGNLKTLKILKASASRWLSHVNSTKRVIEIF